MVTIGGGGGGGVQNPPPPPPPPHSPLVQVNMNGKDDPFYRYTMPRLQIKVEGSTKMIKTGVLSPAN